MKSFLSFRGLFLAGFLVVIVVNGIVLSGVAYNRSGTPDATVELTEREMFVPYRAHKENSGMSLQLKWRVLGKEKDDVYYYGYYGRSPEWFNAEKLRDVGFRVEETTIEPTPYGRHKQPVSKQVFIVLEYDSTTYQQAVARAEALLEKARYEFELLPTDKTREDNFKNAQKRLDQERVTETRLFAVDAGIDPEKLRARYPDMSRFIITPGIVKVHYSYKEKKKIPYGYISRLSVERVNVPLNIRKAFGPILERKKSVGLSPPRYSVQLAYGRRFEPWIESVLPTGKQ